MVAPDAASQQDNAPAEFDSQAAALLFSRYAERLTRVAERHLSRRVAVREGGEDIVQSVFRTFFRRASEGEFQIDGSAQIWRLLVKITLLKARAKGRCHTAEKRDVKLQHVGEEEAWLAAAADREPGPEDAVVLVDQIEALLEGLPPLYSQLLDLKLQGHTVVDIAAQLGVSRQTVYRAMNLLQSRLEVMAADMSRP